MTVLGNVFDSLRTISQWQLLLAFIACIGYSLAQGSLLAARTRTFTALVAMLSALAFVLLGATWAQSTMLVAFAVAGLGGFAAIAWVSGRLLGFSATSPVDAAQSMHDEAAGTADPDAATATVSAMSAGSDAPTAPTASAVHASSQRAPMSST